MIVEMPALLYTKYAQVPLPDLKPLAASGGGTRITQDYKRNIFPGLSLGGPGLAFEEGWRYLRHVPTAAAINRSRCITCEV